MIRPVLVLSAVVALPSAAVFAEPVLVELTDGLIDHAARESDRKLQKVAFERDQLEQRGNFLRALKALPADQRAEPWRRFRDAQKQRERKFLQGLEKTEQIVERGDA